MTLLLLPARLCLQVDPFDKNSPIKQAAIEKFPPDMFFVLRVVQLLRGMANGESLQLTRGEGNGLLTAMVGSTLLLKGNLTQFPTMWACWRPWRHGCFGSMSMLMLQLL